MNDVRAAAWLLWFTVFAYALAGSIDLGASFWRLALARNSRAWKVADRYVSPLWEAANVFLVLVAVALAGFFPGAAYAFGTVLLLPVSAVLILLALRASFLAYAHAAPDPPEVVWAVPGVTGLLLPMLLVLILPASQGGFVQGQGAQLHLELGRFLLNPGVWAYAAFGGLASLFLSAVFLADYAVSAANPAGAALFRRHALWTGPLALVAGIASVFLDPTSRWIRQQALAHWPWFAASLLAFLLAMLCLAFAERLPWSRLAVVLVALQLALASVGYGLAHAAYLLYPQEPTSAAFSNRAMFGDLLWVVVVGLCVLTPAFVWLWRLFVLDPRYTRGG